eukprot:4907498-Pleurochrysis_carterae.AAC.1
MSQSATATDSIDRIWPVMNSTLPPPPTVLTNSVPNSTSPRTDVAALGTFAPAMLARVPGSLA